MRQILLSDYYRDFYGNDLNDEEERRSRRRILFVSLVFIVISVCPCLLYLSYNIKFAKMSYIINSLRDEEKKLKEQSAFLQAEKEQLGSLQRIAEIAQKRLGLVPLDNGIIPMRE